MAKSHEETARERGAACDPICGLCGRAIPPHARQSVHHLVPKLKGGKGGPTALLHEICHRKIHATFSEGELARRYNTLALLRDVPEITSFIKWLAGKDPAFHAPTRKPAR